MNEPQNNKLNMDDQLADFTDYILNKKTAEQDEHPFDQDPELRALKQTALRLKNAFHNDDLSKTVIQRMHQNITMQLQQESKETDPFWKRWIPRQKWQPQQSRQRMSVAISLAILFVLMVISAPYLNGISLDQPATSGQNLSSSILVVSGALIFLAIWLIRRKR